MFVVLCVGIRPSVHTIIHIAKHPPTPDHTNPPPPHIHTLVYNIIYVQLLEFDPKTGHYYFFNTRTGESRWAEEADFEKKDEEKEGRGRGHVRMEVEEGEEDEEEEEAPRSQGMVLAFTGACVVVGGFAWFGSVWLVWSGWMGGGHAPCS